RDKQIVPFTKSQDKELQGAAFIFLEQFNRRTASRAVRDIQSTKPHQAVISYPKITVLQSIYEGGHSRTNFCHSH
ncbi:unnamed protein product, partial [marine sediment metagenome]